MKLLSKYIKNKRFHTVMYFIVQNTLGRRSKTALDYWAWNMTPLPMGYPFPYQYWLAIQWAITGKQPHYPED